VTNTIELTATNSIEPNKSELLAGFKIGFAEDKNKRYRRTMEDAHSFFYNFNKAIGQGWFGIFDGHAGKTAAEWCGSNLHENFIKILGENPDLPIPEILHKSFLFTDVQLGEKKGLFSGCTVAVAFLRSEQREDESGTKSSKRVLYTANAGDARIVLSRNEVATRLSYDHKGSDANEAHRIVDAGGFVMNNRVNGVLAVTRSLGDVTMKEWIIGDPYTTETELDEKDDFMILACDGLWDVCTDQVAVDLVKDITDPQEASDKLLEYALTKCSTDNLSIMVVRFEAL
jgi:protein phosphatase PTC1